MERIVIIDAPSILGLRPSGVEYAPQAMKAAGLLRRLNAEYGGLISPLEKYDSRRDEKTMLLNANGIRHYSMQLADALTKVLQRKQFPVVLGGDCSIVIGNLLALRKLGRFGLFFIDGHADFYQPAASPTGEVADMDLAIVSGRGPEILTDIGGLKPLVRDEDIVLFGSRDAEQAKSYGSQNVKETDIHVIDLEKIHEIGISAASSEAVEKVATNNLEGFWIHLDVDVLKDELMPAVDYRLNGGMEYEELTQLLQILLSSGKAIGMDITIFNPTLDPDGWIIDKLVSSLVAGLSFL